MPGLLSSAFAMTICDTDRQHAMNVDALRKGAFTEVPDPEGFRSGWVGLGNLVDTDNFFLATCDNRFAGFSFRLDARKPSGAVVRLQLAEKIREEEIKGNKVSGKKKKELREEIIARLTANAEYVPAMTDCLWDAATGRLIIGSVADKTVERIIGHFKGCFGIDAVPMTSDMDMGEVFAQIQKNNGLDLKNYFLQPMGSASLKAVGDNAEVSAIEVQNNLDAVSEALNQGLSINRISLVATEKNSDEKQLFFVANENLTVTGLRLPKPDKENEEDATFLINSAICSDVVEMMVEMGGEIKAG